MIKYQINGAEELKATAYDIKGFQNKVLRLFIPVIGKEFWLTSEESHTTFEMITDEEMWLALEEAHQEQRPKVDRNYG